MQFQVPQFLDVEDKIFGPLTAKQFVFILGGIGGMYVVWRLIPWWFIAMFPALAILGMGLGLAFYKFNNRPFIHLIESGFTYLISSKMYIWKRREKKEKLEDIDLKLTRVTHGKGLPAAGGSKLSSLHWEMDASRNVVDQEYIEPDDQI
jgi:hypothetical protein